MLVVDLHTLQTIHILYFVDDVLLDGRGTLDGQDVGRRDDTVRERCSGTHGIVLLYQYLLGEGHEVLALLTGLRGDHNLAVTALHLTHGDLTVDF